MRPMPCTACLIHAITALAFVLTAGIPAAIGASLAGTASAPADMRYPAIDPSFSKPDAHRMPGRATLRALLSKMEGTMQANTFCFVQQSFKPRRPDEKGESVVWMISHEGMTIQDVNTVPQGQRYRPDPALDDATRGAVDGIRHRHREPQDRCRPD